MLEPVAKLRNLTILPLASLRSVGNAACAAAVAVAHACAYGLVCIITRADFSHEGEGTAHYRVSHSFNAD